MLLYPVPEYLDDWQAWSWLGLFSRRNPGPQKTLLLLREGGQGTYVFDSRDDRQVSEGRVILNRY